MPKIAEPVPKTTDVTAADRKSVTSKSASAKAASSPAKTAATARERREVPDVIIAVQRANGAANAIIVCAWNLSSFRTDAASKAVRNLFYLLILNQPPLTNFRGSAVAEHENAMTYFVR